MPGHRRTTKQMAEPPVDHGPVDVETVAQRLADRGEPFVRATVVRREPPVSATVGDRAIVTADGEIHGWIGGVECAQSAVIEEARLALETGEPRLVGMAPDPATIDRPGLEARPMTCHGGGTLEVFLEPTRPAATLLLVGTTAVAASIGQFAADLGFAVTVVDPSGEGPDYATSVIEADDASAIATAVEGAPIVVVASMGAMDAVGIAAAIELEAPYIGLVANERRATEVFERAAERLGIEEAAVRDAVTVPAGIEIGARTPAEIGVSVAAGLVRVRREVDGSTLSLPAPPETVTDPVCGMAVDPAEPAATVEHAGETYYFCSAGCAETFDADPEAHLADA